MLFSFGCPLYIQKTLSSVNFCSSWILVLPMMGNLVETFLWSLVEMSSFAAIFLGEHS